MGRLWWPDGAATKNLQAVTFRFGAITKAGGSSLRVSLQNMDTVQTPAVSATVPGNPDGVVLRSFSIANADPNFATNVAYPMSNFDSPLTVNFGQVIAMVLDFQNFGGSDSATLGYIIAQTNQHESAISQFNGTAWTAGALPPSCLFQADDGSYIAFDYAWAIPFVSAALQQSLTNVSNPSEYALCYQLPYAHKIDAIAATMWTPNVNTPFNLAIYDGTTPLVTVPCRPAYMGGTTFRPFVVSLREELQMDANHQYCIGIAPTSAAIVNMAYTEVPNNAMYSVFPGGRNVYLAQRPAGGGPWTFTTNRRTWLNIRISSIDTGSGNGGDGGPRTFPVRYLT